MKRNEAGTPVLDQLDRQIVAVLQNDARTSWSTIARVVGTSEATISRRAQRLIDSGVLLLSAAANPGHDRSSSDVFVLLSCTTGYTRSVSEALAARPEVRFAAILTGVFDVVVEITFLSVDELTSFVVDEISKIPGVENANTLTIVHNWKTANTWARGLIGESKLPLATPLPGSLGSLHLDAIDVQLIDLLRANPRSKSAELAVSAGTSEAMVRRRLDTLISHAALQFSTYIPPQLMGFSFEAFLWINVDSRSLASVAERLSELNAVRYVSNAAGSFNLLVEVVFHDLDEIHDFQTVILADCEGIRRVDITLELQTIKRNFANVARPAPPRAVN